MAITLNEVNQQLIANQQEQQKSSDEQQKSSKKTNSILGEIAKDFRDYFREQQTKSLDELEKERERKRSMRDERGRFQAVKTKDEEKSLINLGKLSIFLSTLAFSIGAIAGSAAGVFNIYKNFWIGEQSAMSNFVKKFKETQARRLDWIKALPGSIANSIKLMVYDRLGLAPDGKIKVFQDPKTGKFTSDANFVKKFREIRESIRSFTQPITTYFSGIGATISEFVKSFKLPTFDFKFNFVERIGAFVERLGIFGRIVTGTFTLFSKLISVVLLPIIGIYNFFKGFNQTEGNFFQKYLGAIKQATQGLFNFLVTDLVTFILDGIGSILNFFNLKTVGNFLKKMSKAFEDGVNAIFEGVQFVIENPTETIRILGQQIKNIYDVIKEGLKKFINKIIATARQIASNPLDFVKNLFSSNDETSTNNGNNQTEQDLTPEQKKLVQTQREQLIKLEVQRSEGKISDAELKQIQDELAEIRAKAGINMQNIINAPVTTTNASSTSYYDAPSSATDDLDRTK